MPLVIGFAELLGAALLLTSAITGARFSDVIAGRAGQLYRQNQTAGASSAPAVSTPTGTIPTPNAAGYVNPLVNASGFGRTDQGVDATLPAGAPIPAPSKVKIIGIVKDWYAGQPAVFFELLDGPDAGKVQYVGEQITQLPAVGQVLDQGQAIAIGANSGTGIEYGWGTTSLQTLAQATGGYLEGQVTHAGEAMRQWLSSVGANVGIS